MQAIRCFGVLGLLTLCACSGGDGNASSSSGEGGDGASSPSSGGSDGSPTAGIVLARSNALREPSPTVDNARIALLGADNQAFAFSLFHDLRAREGADKLFFSPFSISVALAMTYAGARDETEREMAEAMHFSLPQPALHTAFNWALQQLDQRADDAIESAGGQGVELHVTSEAFGKQDYSFMDEYLDLLALNYGAGVQRVSYEQPDAARDLINAWVSAQTAMKVPEILPPGSIDASTRLVLANAIYFKASWLFPFDESATAAADFIAPSGVRRVEMMHDTRTRPYFEGEDYQAVELPYLSPSVSMLLVLPADGQLEAVAQAFDGAAYRALRSALGSALVDLSLPKWSFSSSHKLKQPLQSLGMQRAFSAQTGLSAIARDEALYIDEVYHQAFVGVDESGTEATAATAVVLNADGGIDPEPPPVVEMTLNRPFFFVIYDEPTHQILFIGQLIDPA